MSSNDVYIVAAHRTAIGAFLGQFSKVPAHDLGSTVIKQCVSSTGIPPEEVSEVIMGQVLTAGQGQNPARQASMKAGIPPEVPAYTINMLCGSGLKAVAIGYQAICNGDSTVVICGGQENMSAAHHSCYMRSFKYGSLQLQDTVLVDGLTDAFHGCHMGLTAEHLATKYTVPREVQDSFAFNSQQKAKDALINKYFEKEIVPVCVSNSKTVNVDEFPKPDCDLAKLAKLQTAFEKDPNKNPSVTAGNSSGINDGAAAVMICSREFVEAKQLKPLAKIIAFAQVGIVPLEMGLGPVGAIRKVLEKAKWTIHDVDLYEVNEAFAVQSHIVIKTLGLDASKVNITGGAVALGHPLGSSGARILVTLIHNLQRLNKKKGVAALCVGGGMGIAIAIDCCS